MKKLILVVWLLGSTCGLHAETLKVATANWSPYAIIEKETGITGISVEIMRAIAQRTQHTLEINIFPAKRLNDLFNNNEIDVNFADSPLWNETTEKPVFVFTEPYLSVKEYIYFTKERYIEVKTPQDLAQKRVGIMRGYYYAMFEEAFNQKLVIKDEVNAEIALVEKLKLNRNDAVFMDDTLFNYLLGTTKEDPSRFKRGIELTDSPVGLKVRIEKQQLVPKFNQAILQLKKEGVIEKILKKYTH